MTLTASRALVKMLHAQGVKVIFGLPGDTSMAFYEALREVARDHARPDPRRAFRLVYGRCLCARQPPSRRLRRAQRRRRDLYAARCGRGQLFLRRSARLHDRHPPARRGAQRADRARPGAAFCPRSPSGTPGSNAPTRCPRSCVAPFVWLPADGQARCILRLPQDVLYEATPEASDSMPIPHAAIFPAYRSSRRRCKRSPRRPRLLCAAQRPVLVAGGGAVLAQAWEEITRLAESLQPPRRHLDQRQRQHRRGSPAQHRRCGRQWRAPLCQ